MGYKKIGDFIMKIVEREFSQKQLDLFLTIKNKCYEKRLHSKRPKEKNIIII